MFYFEKQRSLKCAIHAMNNILRNDTSSFRKRQKVVDGKKPEDDYNINIARVCEDILRKMLQGKSKAQQKDIKRDYKCKSAGDYADDVVRKTFEELDLDIVEYSPLLLDKPRLLERLLNRSKLDNFLGFFLQTNEDIDHYVALLVRENQIWLLDSMAAGPRKVRKLTDIDRIGMIWGIYDNDDERTDVE